MIRNIGAALAAILTLALLPAAGLASVPGNAASPVTQGARHWHVTGHWRGVQRDTIGNRFKVRLVVKRRSSGRLHGRGAYRYKGEGVVCRTTLRFKKRSGDGWRVFREHVWYGRNYCGKNRRVRMHRWPRRRLRVKWPLATNDAWGTLHRP